MKKFSLIAVIMLGSTLNGAGAPVPHFSGEKAFVFLKAQCEFGPRNPGSAGHDRCRDYLLSTLKKSTPDVTTQIFSYSLPAFKSVMKGANIIARFHSQKKDRILLCAHWDTRPWADEETLPEKRKMPVMGANDGASGVAVLLHLAELLASQPPDIGVDIVLFDAEDAGDHFQNRSWALGSAAFARDLLRTMRPRFGILLDMIGDADLNVYQEAFSTQYAGFIVQRVWQKAAELGEPCFIPQVGYSVYDDHIPLLEAGVPCIDIIDFEYPYWHTLHDTPDKCSPTSLESIGRVITAIIYEEK
ncbi:MAG: M28 family peptidase [Calditrichaeota bacterium]|nr:MAG: M28 family peptidase [Calditrichota bacterium]